LTRTAPPGILFAPKPNERIAMGSQQVEKHPFQAEVNEVLSIVVNSLYSHKEVFLRELISNASDALDKLSFRALTEHGLLGDDKDLRIDLIPDKDAGTLLIRDNGVGMTHDELIDNLGTIARSGSKQLMQALAAKGEVGDRPNLIGQFGVGFYSSFLVADKVTVTSRAAGAAEAWQWQSEAKGGYTLEESEKEGRGTNVILHLKDDCKEFLDEWQVKSLVRKYSDYVRYPIRLRVERTKASDDDDEKAGTEKGWDTVNQANALWTRPKAEIADQQYDEFYKHLSHDWEPPLARTHFKVEGAQEMTGLLFVPKRAPFDLLERRNRGVRLFVKRVFIMDDCEELLPEWLRFVRGVIDSEDLPLNVSRETLQQDRVTRQIRKQIVQKTLALLAELADEGETTITEENDDGEPTERKVRRYELFWRQFGRVLKEGIHFDPGHKDEIARLLRYESTREEGLTSLHDYVARMQPDQPGIYYITAPSIEAARRSPHLEGLKKRGYEVLYMVDAVDEWVVQPLAEFDDKKLIPAAKGALELPETDDEKKVKETRARELGGLLEHVQKALDKSVKEVRLTSRLTDSPACLVSDEHELSPHVERMLRTTGQDIPEHKRILELNPEHAIVKALAAKAESADEEEVARWSSLLFDSALLAEGTMPKDPAAFAKAVTELMQRSMS
jgi:molecular chaperone HtpG